MIVSFADQTTEDIYHGKDTKAARRIPKSVWPVAQRKMDMINAAHDVSDLRTPPGNQLHALHGALAGYYAIRVNDQYRVIFRFGNHNASDVKVTDYH